ncbi:MAG: hypothetical protein JW994_07570 [Candidatus Omnitrophica bacterium]|nr:hypothetical protein [Candidatus Omnitrophota bacterium]
MSDFLRDVKLQNLELSEASLQQIYKDFKDIVDTANSSRPTPDDKLFQFHIIRFDNKGFRLVSFDDVIKHYQDARTIERLFFYIYSGKFLKMNGINGTSIELALNVLAPDKCTLTVQDDNQAWVDAIFSKLKARLDKYHGKNYLIRNRVTGALIQLLGVFAGIIVSIWLGGKIASILTIQHPHIFGFFVVFLVFSNLWGYLYGAIGNLLDRMFPNITFMDKVRWRGFIQGIIYAVLSVGFLTAVYRIWQFAFQVIRSVTK